MSSAGSWLHTGMMDRRTEGCKRGRQVGAQAGSLLRVVGLNHGALGVVPQPRVIRDGLQSLHCLTSLNSEGPTCDPPSTCLAQCLPELPYGSCRVIWTTGACQDKHTRLPGIPPRSYEAVTCSGCLQTVPAFHLIVIFGCYY